jgi:ribosome biogenesis GTPase A
VTYSGNVTEQIEGIRRQTVAVLDDLIAKAGEFELADPPAALGRYREKLRENAYKVLVVGEAKRGKSTFVNALIGRDILPIDVDVATMEVSKGVKLLDVRAKRARRPCGATKGRA